MKDIARSALRSAAIGAVAGMRTFSAPAWTASSLHARSKGLFAAMAAFETIADKTPWIGNRTGAPQVVARLASGGTSAFLADQGKHSLCTRAAFALIGATTALGLTYAAFHARRWLGTRFKLPDPLVGGVEDALAFSVGRLVA